MMLMEMMTASNSSIVNIKADSLISSVLRQVRHAVAQVLLNPQYASSPFIKPIIFSVSKRELNVDNYVLGVALVRLVSGSLLRCDPCSTNITNVPVGCCFHQVTAP